MVSFGIWGNQRAGLGGTNRGGQHISKPVPKLDSLETNVTVGVPIVHRSFLRFLVGVAHFFRR